jgi:peptidoglycan/xylan/chitin deacetylase (PgdA/CDA1 family)
MAICPASCRRTPGGTDGKPPLERCLEGLNRIPELAALRARDKEEPSAGRSSLQGLEVAFTLDDMVRSEGATSDVETDDLCERENSRENFDKLLAALKQNAMPPTVDFAVGQGMDPKFAADWVAAGNLLGSMTFSRKKPNKTGSDEFIADLARNDQVLSPFWKSDSKTVKYFRYPKLKLSLESSDRAKIDRYLADNGYVLAPATIDAHDEKFSWVYCAALERSDSTCINLIKAYFQSLLLDTTAKARESARQIAGREVKHILVFKANQFTCDHLGEILGWYKGLGVKFIPLAEAMADPFYKMVDEEGRPAGIKVIRKVKTAQQGEK